MRSETHWGARERMPLSLYGGQRAPLAPLLSLPTTLLHRLAPPPTWLHIFSTVSKTVFDLINNIKCLYIQPIINNSRKDINSFRTRNLIFFLYYKYILIYIIQSNAFYFAFSFIFHFIHLFIHFIIFFC